MHTAQDTTPGLILIVDDLEDNREMLRVSLELFGYQVQVAANGKEALQAVAQQHFGAVVTDMWMPDMNGAEFIQAARMQASSADLPIILVSASFDQFYPQQVAADAFLKKPFGITPLIGLLTRFNCPPPG